MEFDRWPESLTLVARIGVSKRLRRRVWLAMLLINLGAWVLGCDVEIEPIERLEE